MHGATITIEEWTLFHQMHNYQLLKKEYSTLGLKTECMQEQISFGGTALFNEALQFQTAVLCVYNLHRIASLFRRFGGHCSLHI
jgi:hypothetical protein